MVVFFAMLIGAMSLMGVPSSLQAVTTAQGAAFKVFQVSLPFCFPSFFSACSSSLSDLGNRQDSYH